MRGYYIHYEESPLLNRVWPPGIRNIILLNCAVFIIQLAAHSTRSFPVEAWFNLIPSRVFKGEVWRLLSYAFLHQGLLHIFINMMMLWMLGRDVEEVLGTRNFVVLYLLSGIAAGLCTALLSPYGIVVGASGAVLGVVMAFGMLFPTRMVFVWFIFPVPAKILVFMIALIELVNVQVAGTSDHIAHFAHLGGMAFGYMFTKKRYWWESHIETWWQTVLAFYHRVFNRHPANEDFDFEEYTAGFDEGDLDIRDEVELDRILQKIKREGMSSLTWMEKQFLEEMSRRFRENRKRRR